MERKLFPGLVYLYFLASAIAALTVSHGQAQGLGSDERNSYLVGKWTYRSFRNDPTIGTPVDGLLFGEGVMSITSVKGEVITGTFDFGPGFEMEFKGTVSDGPPVTIRFEGKGIGDQNKDWLYDYSGYLAYHWPKGIDQKDSIVGTVLRV